MRIRRSVAALLPPPPPPPDDDGAVSVNVITRLPPGDSGLSGSAASAPSPHGANDPNSVEASAHTRSVLGSLAAAVSVLLTRTRRRKRCPATGTRGACDSMVASSGPSPAANAPASSCA